jgi:hypothetical protein
VRDADVRIASNPVTEGYVNAVLDPETHLEELRSGDEPAGAYAKAIAARVGEVEPVVRGRIRERRAALVENGAPVETYRRTQLDDALARLAPG